MNEPADWDVIWKWQWFRREAWKPHFQDAGHPEGRPARLAAIYGTLLQQYESRAVMECSCGLGLRTICLQDAGFEVTGTDPSQSAIKYALTLSSELGRKIHYRHSIWSDLAECFGPDFDAVINDEFAWTIKRSELRFAAHNFHALLKPGGIFVFTGANEWSEPEDRAARIDSSFNLAPQFQLRDDYEADGSRMSLVVAREKGDHGIVENYLFVVRDENGPRLETASICNSVDWGWSDFQAVCREAGFVSLESVKVPAGKREHIFNVARK